MLLFDCADVDFLGSVKADRQRLNKKLNKASFCVNRRILTGKIQQKKFGILAICCRLLYIQERKYPCC